MEEFIVEKNRLVSTGKSIILHTSTPNVSSGSIKPKYISLYATNPRDSLQDLEYTFTEQDITKESAHVIVWDDTIVQLADFTEKTWHAGNSYWQGYHGLNGFSIGIYFKDSDLSREVLHEILPCIVATYNIRDIIPGKRPISSYLDISEFKPYVDYGNADSAGRFVATAPVFIRGGPHVNFETLDTLKAGESVKILRYSSDKEWAFIIYERSDHTVRHGWTHESFLRRL